MIDSIFNVHQDIYNDELWRSWGNKVDAFTPTDNPEFGRDLGTLHWFNISHIASCLVIDVGGSEYDATLADIAGLFCGCGLVDGFALGTTFHAGGTVFHHVQTKQGRIQTAGGTPDRLVFQTIHAAVTVLSGDDFLPVNITHPCKEPLGFRRGGGRRERGRGRLPAQTVCHSGGLRRHALFWGKSPGG